MFDLCCPSAYSHLQVRLAGTRGRHRRATGRVSLFLLPFKSFGDGHGYAVMIYQVSATPDETNKGYDMVKRANLALSTGLFVPLWPYERQRSPCAVYPSLILRSPHDRPIPRLPCRPSPTFLTRPARARSLSPPHRLSFPRLFTYSICSPLPFTQLSNSVFVDTS